LVIGFLHRSLRRARGIRASERDHDTTTNDSIAVRREETGERAQKSPREAGAINTKPDEALCQIDH
jgi:hypothetical protein